MSGESYYLTRFLSFAKLTGEKIGVRREANAVSRKGCIRTRDSTDGQATRIPGFHTAPSPCGAHPCPARTRLHAQGTRAHAAARPRRRRQRRHKPSFPFRESPAYILCPCLVIYVTAPGPGPPEMAVARGVGSPEPAPPRLYKWGDCGLGEPGCALERPGAAARGRYGRARASRSPNSRS